MSENTEQAAPTMISIGQAARLLMVTEQWVRDLGKKGYITGIERGKVPLVSAVQGYINWIKDEERRSSKTATASKVQEERALEIKQRRELAAGNLVELQAVGALVADVFGVLRSEFAGIPAAVTRDLSMRGDIESRQNDAFARARERFEKQSMALRSNLDRPMGDEAPTS